MRYRLIAGTINRYQPEEGWTNIHLDISPRGIWIADLELPVLPDIVGDIAEMWMLKDEMFDAARLNHVLEHLPYGRGFDALREVHRVLKPGAELDIEVPDLDRVCRAWIAEEIDDFTFQQWVYGEQLPNHEPGDNHRFGWWETPLRKALEGAGFDVGDRVEDTGLALRFVATCVKEDE